MNSPDAPEGLVHKNKLLMIGKLAATLSHEIRSPLSVLKLNLHYLDMYYGGLDSEAKESLSACIESVDRIHFMIENILEFSKKPTTEIEATSLNQLAEKAVFFLNKLAQSKQITIKEEYEHSIPELAIVKNKFLQVLINIITNAIEASPAGSEIIIKSYTKFIGEKNCVIIEIEDFGEGMSKHEKEKIFEDFYTTKKEGTGLGLSVCKSILKDFGANITFQSEKQKGTKFFITIPISIDGPNDDSENTNN
jgi:signal transduction histidine kinase